MGEVIDVHLALRRRVARAGAHAHDRHLGQADRRRLPRRDRPAAIFAAGRVVLASGACNRPERAGASRRRCRPPIQCFTPLDYRNPEQLPDGGVLVVGASATGVQLADEIHRSGRPVTLSVGEHVRLPRTYRGRDVLWWMDASGVWNQRYDEIDDLTRAREAAVAAAGRHARARDARSQRAQRRRRRARRPPGRRARRPRAVLGRAAQSVRAGRSEDGSAARHLRRVGAQPRARRRGRPAGALRADPRAGVVAARVSICGAARSVRSSGRPAFARTTAGSTCRWSIDKGHLRHDGGVVDAPGLYALGLPVLRRRKSTLHPRRRGRRARRDRASRRLPRAPRGLSHEQEKTAERAKSAEQNVSLRSQRSPRFLLVVFAGALRLPPPPRPSGSLSRRRR